MQIVPSADDWRKWTWEDVDRLLELLPLFESKDFVAATWPKRPPVIKDGKTYEQMPYPDYDPAVERFRSLPSFVHPYDPLPEDTDQEGIKFSVLGAHFPLEYFETATANQVLRYISLLHRGERFCDGHIAGEFESGAVVAALRRLKQLRAESE